MLAWFAPADLLVSLCSFFNGIPEQHAEAAERAAAIMGDAVWKDMVSKWCLLSFVNKH